MQMQFHKTQLPCLRRLKSQTLSQEQTQELRLTEDMPDIGTVLGAWGQPLLRGKNWNRGSMELSCGVMVWAMYQPEGGGEPRMVEGWLPFQFRWDLPDTDRDGVMEVHCLVRGVDARVTSARKLLLRATLEVLGEGWVTQETEIPTPEGLPPDIRLLEKTYPVLLPREAGEKAFALDEELTLPSSAPKIQKLLRFSLQPELTDQKVMGDKVVFRGAALLHILYLGEEQGLSTWDFEIPFSQYSELDQAYDQASATLQLALTALELEAEAEGRLRLKAGLTGQYRIQERTELRLTEDAYSPQRHLTLEREELHLPVILEEQSQTVTAQAALPQEVSRVVDLAFYPHPMRLSHKDEGAEGELSGQFQTLFYDENGDLQGASPKWHSPWRLPADDGCDVTAVVCPSGVPQAAGELRGDLLVNLQSMDTRGFSMITAMETGEERQPDPQRPSLILRRCGKDSLWDMAKATGSTVEAIREANRLTGEPDANRMLLIPVP